MIKREIEEFVIKDIIPGKVVLLFGARRVGKTVLLHQLKERFTGRISFLNGEEYSTVEMLSSRSVSDYRSLSTISFLAKRTPGNRNQNQCPAAPGRTVSLWHVS